MLVECKAGKKTILLRILSSLYYYILLAIGELKQSADFKMLVPGYRLEMSIQLRGKVYGFSAEIFGAR